MKKIYAILVALSALGTVLLLAGCGSKPDDTTKTDTGTGTKDTGAKTGS